MLVLAKFTLNDAPKTGLTPNIWVRNANTSSITLATTTMTEIGAGNYRYDWDRPQSSGNYIVDIDGGAAVTNDYERYQSVVVEIDNHRIVYTKDIW